jgi:hypothetical protein
VLHDTITNGNAITVATIFIDIFVN